MVKLWSQGNESLWENKRVLHFAPDANQKIFRPKAGDYVTADIKPGRADIVLNIEDIDLPDSSKDFIVCAHVLEHVDDEAALANMFRILAPGGTALLLFPIVEGWETTYENSLAVTDADRYKHFGQHDHVRFFGRDVRDKIRSAGFSLTEYVADGESAVTYGLMRGERIFIARKPLC